MTIEAVKLKIGKSCALETVYFSGGLKGWPTDRGWALFPVSADPNSDALVFSDQSAHFQYATQECQLKFIGACVHYEVNENLPQMDIWESGNRDPQNGLNAADSWSAVGHQAALQGDKEYANCATYVSVCLRVAGLRLRDISNKYHAQLNWALLSKKKPGRWFSNAALLDLYADFHSLMSELSSTRDYLAKIAAIHAGAPERVDSLARLEDWISKSSNRSCASQPLVHLLLSASGTKESPGWLRRLGDIRNEMLHKIPMGANERVSGLTLEEINTSLGAITTIRLAEPMNKTPLDKQPPDPLRELSELSAHLERLCRAGWKMAKYPAELPCVIGKSAI